jgi:hypothetical protein
VSDNHQFNYHAYYDGPKDHEAHVTVPRVSEDASDPEIILHISKVGGGTVGRAYAGNWAYCVIVDGEETLHGDGLTTPLPRTHRQAARVLAAFAADGYDPEGSVYERLTSFAEDLNAE